MNDNINGLFPFQISLETVRAHHWRYFYDAYQGCEFNCQYCLYKGPGDYGRHVHASRVEPAPDRPIGIVDIGANTDPYQPVEAQNLVTKRVLRNLLESGTATFVLTRGSLIERDVELLKRFAERGLIEVCFSVITLNDDLSRHLEPRAPAPAERLRVAGVLSNAGIPVSFHVAPLIPGLHSMDEWTQLGHRLGELSGRHVFSAVLGAQKGFWKSFYDVAYAARHLFSSWITFAAAYTENPGFAPDNDGAITCELSEVLDDLLALRAGVVETGAVFVSENYPYLTTGALNDGIYRWKIPTVFDMVEHLRTQDSHVSWDRFMEWYQRFEPTRIALDVVRAGWRSGDLFSGTNVARYEATGGDTCYSFSEFISEPTSRTLLAHRLIQ